MLQKEQKLIEQAGPPTGHFDWAVDGVRTAAQDLAVSRASTSSVAGCALTATAELKPGCDLHRQVLSGITDNASGVVPANLATFKLYVYTQRDGNYTSGRLQQYFGDPNGGDTIPPHQARRLPLLQRHLDHPSCRHDNIAGRVSATRTYRSTTEPPRKARRQRAGPGPHTLILVGGRDQRSCQHHRHVSVVDRGEHAGVPLLQPKTPRLLTGRSQSATTWGTLWNYSLDGVAVLDGTSNANTQSLFRFL